jgi:hypothetical protein
MLHGIDRTPTKTALVVAQYRTGRIAAHALIDPQSSRRVPDPSDLRSYLDDRPM